MFTLVFMYTDKSIVIVMLFSSVCLCMCLHSWEEKVPLACGGLEKAWLFHEIGRCYLELKRYGEARDYGSRSLTAADDISDEKWQLNASVLMAQAECESKLHRPESQEVSGLMHFVTANNLISHNAQNQ